VPNKVLRELRFPMGGLNRRFAYRLQPPYTTAEAVNVRPDGVPDGRERGGSRPGLCQAYYNDLEDPIRMLAKVTHIEEEDNDLAVWVDGFTGPTLNPTWEAAGWSGAPSLPDTLVRDKLEVVYPDEIAALRRSFPISISGDGNYSTHIISMLLVPWHSQYGGTFRLYARMDEGDPDITDYGVVAELDLAGSSGDYSGTLTSYADGTPTEYEFDEGSVGYAGPGWFTMIVAQRGITCLWRGNVLTRQLVAATSPATLRSRVGFGVKATVSGSTCLVDQFRLEYHSSAETGPKQVNTLVVSVAGNVYYEREDHLTENADVSPGLLRLYNTDLNLDSSHYTCATEQSQKLYIADYGPVRISGTDGSIDATGKKLTASGVSDWRLYDIDANNDVVVVTDGTGDIDDGTYTIESVAETEVNLDSSAGGAGNCSYNIQRGPKVLDPAELTLELWTATADKGQVPTGCPLIASYRNRVVLAKDHVWYMSRSGDPNDFDYGAGAEDALRAVAGSNTDAGDIAEPMTALIPWGDDFFIFACERSMWLLRGDPALGGIIDNITRSIGIIAPKAWCYGPDGVLLFLSRDGFYAMPASGQGKPESISRERLPRELSDIDGKQFDVFLAYDQRARGVHITQSPIVVTQAPVYDPTPGAPDPPDCDCDTLESQVHLYLPFEGDIADYSQASNDFTAGAYGECIYVDDATPVGTWGRCAKFYWRRQATLSLSDAADLEIDLDNGTDFSFWVYLPEADEDEGTDPTLWEGSGLKCSAHWSASEEKYMLDFDGRVETPIGSFPVGLTSSTTLSADTWYHVLVEFSENQAALTISPGSHSQSGGSWPWVTGETVIPNSAYTFNPHQTVRNHLIDEFTVIQTPDYDFDIYEYGIEDIFREEIGDEQDAEGDWTDFAKTYNGEDTDYGQCDRTRESAAEVWASWKGFGSSRPSDAYLSIKIDTQGWKSNEKWALCCSYHESHGWEPGSSNVITIKAAGTEQVTGQWYNYDIPAEESWDWPYMEAWLYVEANGEPSAQSLKVYYVAAQEGQMS